MSDICEAHSKLRCSDCHYIKELEQQLQQKEEQLDVAAVEFENLLHAQLTNDEYEKCVALIRKALNSKIQESLKTTKEGNNAEV